MESNLLPAPANDIQAESVQQTNDAAAADVMAQLRKAIMADCRNAPQQYIDEIHVAEGGE